MKDLLLGLRKFLICLSAMGIVTWLMASGRVEATIGLSTLGGIVLAYLTANVVDAKRANGNGTAKGTPSGGIILKLDDRDIVAALSKTKPVP